MVYKFFDKKTAGIGVKSIPQNEQLAEDKLTIENCKKRKVYSVFKGNIFGADLADMQLISKFNEGLRFLLDFLLILFLLCVIDIYSKYAWVAPLKDKKDLSVVNAFQKILDDSTPLNSKRKPNKIWVDKGSEFYNSHFKKWLKDNNIEMFSTHNKGKSVVAERFIRTIKNKIYKYMTSISKNVYIDKLDDIVNDTTIHIIEQLK